MTEEPLKEMTKTFETFRHRHDISNVFQDWLELVAIEISNPVDVRNHAQRNERYKRIMERYNQEDFKKFGDLVGMLMLLIEKEPDDYLGRLYMQLELYNSFRGQYFTPISVAMTIAEMEVGDVDEMLKKQKYVSANDPACGSAVTLIALYKCLKERGHNPQQVLQVVAQDIDSKAVHMAYIQLSLMGLNARVILGDTLSQEVRDVWRSPGYFFDWGYGVDEKENRDAEILEKMKKVNSDPIIEGEETVQLSFF